MAPYIPHKAEIPKASNGSLDVPRSKIGLMQIEHHACQVGEEAETGNDEVVDHVVVGPLVEGHDAQEAAQRVEDERAEVGSQRDGEQGVGQRGELVVRGVAEAREDAVRQSGDGCIGGRAGVGEDAARQPAHR